MYAKLAHTNLLWGPHRARLHQLANSFRELSIDDPDDSRGLTSSRGAELGGTGYLYESNPPGIQQRDHLLETVARRIGGDDGERHFVLLDVLPHLLDADDRAASAHPKTDEPKQPAPGRGVQSHSLAPRFADCTSPSDCVSSVVSSSSSAMMRSASSGAMPARRRKSSRSRSMMSLSVR